MGYGACIGNEFGAGGRRCSELAERAVVSAGDGRVTPPDVANRVFVAYCTDRASATAPGTAVGWIRDERGHAGACALTSGLFDERLGSYGQIEK